MRGRKAHNDGQSNGRGDLHLQSKHGNEIKPYQNNQYFILFPIFRPCTTTENRATVTSSTNKARVRKATFSRSTTEPSSLSANARTTTISTRMGTAISSTPKVRQFLLHVRVSIKEGFLSHFWWHCVQVLGTIRCHKRKLYPIFLLFYSQIGMWLDEPLLLAS